jgi:16S rRNA (uracil1498-N3)-methyltransferase
MPPRFYVDRPFLADETLALPSTVARHVQVLRLQPGDPLTLFNGQGGEWTARVTQMGRSDVQVQLQEHHAVDRELPLQVTLAIGMPANERMDALIEKATELGVAAIQPLVCERSVLRLAGERAQKRLLHWQGVAVAASEQSGRTRVPRLDAVCALESWLAGLASASTDTRVVLSLGPAATAPSWPRAGALVCLSGPEGGLAPAEEAAARQCGFNPVSLGPRVLRADTAPLAWLAQAGMSMAATAG